MKEKLDEARCRAAMAGGEFPPEVRGAAPRVAIVLTQSWCPQWHWMKGYLDAIAAEPDTAVFWLEYDREKYFEEFRNFKEDLFGNREIPYVRYYRDGMLVRESNYIDRSGFMRLLGAGGGR